MVTFGRIVPPLWMLDLHRYVIRRVTLFTPDGSAVPPQFIALIKEKQGYDKIGAFG